MKSNFFNAMENALDVFAHREDERYEIARYLQQVFIALQRYVVPDISLEIGARDAEYSKRVRSALPEDVPVVAFEGSPATYRHYAKELALFYPGIQYLPLIVSDTDGEKEFFEYFDADNHDMTCSAGWSSLLDTRKGLLDRVQKKSAVYRAVTGDGFLRANSPGRKNISLWIDVEGAQDLVFQGFGETFSSGAVASVFIEVEAKKLWDTQKMLVKGIMEHMARHGLVACFLDNQFLAQSNIIFIRKDLVRLHTAALRELADQYIECIENLR